MHSRSNPNRRTTPRSSGQRGFTIIELIVVVAIVGVMVAAAAPSFINWLKDERVTDSAQQIADMYRHARARAMGRGSAMAVRWNEAAATPTNAAPWGQFSLFEGVVGAGGALNAVVGMSSCMTPDFVNAPNANVQFVARHEPRDERYKPALARFFDWVPNQLAWATICYTPSGRVWWQNDPANPMQPMNGVPRIEVENTITTARRQVILPPTGAARLVLRLP